jgi:hypothetical protein
MSIVFDALGWLGAILLLVAYVLVSSKRVDGRTASYQLLNIVGSLLLLSNNVHYGAYPSGFVNLVWSLVAVVAIRHASTGTRSS